VLAGAGSLLAFPAFHAQAQTAGVALVIGNSKYKWEASLPNVKRDAPDIARRFQEFGLKTELVHDLGRGAMQEAIARFSAASRGARLAAFYFAGHGVSSEGQQYLVPVDADLNTPNVLEPLIRGRTVRDGFAEAANRLMVFDNCRNNPADGWLQKAEENRAAGRSAESRFREDDSPNTVVLFSTIPGRTALDGPAGQNSPFAAALLRQLAEPSVDLSALPRKLRRDLLIATAGRQVLWDRNNFNQSFTISAPADARARAQGAGDPKRVVELANGYAYAEQSGLTLPPGLIAYRPPPGSRDAGRVGSFKYTGFNQEASLLVVMSVEDPQNVELVQAYRDKQQRTKWRFLRGVLSGDNVDFENPDQNLRWAFRWSDANSGRLSIIPQRGGARARTATGSFARLDG
jgi:hypothetical protein